MPLVEVPEHGTVEFPDTMTGDEISAAIQKNFPEFQKKQVPTITVGSPGPVITLDKPVPAPLESESGVSQIVESSNPAKKLWDAANYPLIKFVPEWVKKYGAIELPATLANAAVGLFEHPTKAQRYGQGAAQGVTNLAEGFSSPIGIATLGMGALPRVVQRAISIGFATQLFSQVPEVYKQLDEEFKKPPEQRDEKKIGTLITQGVGALGMGTMATAHGVLPGKGILAPKTVEAVKQLTGKETPDASTIRSNAGQVQETGNVVESGQVKSGENLQQQTSGTPGNVGTPRQENVPSETPGAERVLESPDKWNRLYKLESEDIIDAQRRMDESVEGSDEWKAAKMNRDDSIQRLDEFDKLSKRDLSQTENPTVRALRIDPKLNLPDAISEGQRLIEQDRSDAAYDAVLDAGGTKSEAVAASQLKPVGASTPEDIGAKPQLAQLTDAIKTLAEQSPKQSKVSTAFDMGEAAQKVKDGVSESVEGLKAAGSYLKQKLIGRPVVTEYGSALGQRHLELSESAANAKKFVQSSTRAVPSEKIQAAISNYIDTGGDTALLNKAIAETKSRYKAGYEAAKTLTPEQKTIAANAKNYFESRLQDAMDAGILEDGIEDYIHRTYESDSPWKRGVLAELRSGIFTGRPALAKQRVFQYDFEAEKAGKTPVKSFIKRITAYDLSLNKAIADRKLIKTMMGMKMSDGRPMIDVGGIGTPIDKAGVTEATLIKPSWKPTDPNTPLKNRGDFKPFDHPALRKWKWVAQDANGKPIFVQGDVMVHPEAIGKIKALFEPSRVRQNPIGRAALGVSSTIKQTMLDLSGFHLTQITVHGWEHRTFKPVGEIDFQNPDVRGLVKGGMVVGDYRAQELFSEGLASASLTRYIPGVGKYLQAWQEYLFQSYIPRIKTAMALHALERNRAKFGKELSEEQLYKLTADEAQAAFGELNYEMMGRSKTMQDILRIAMLAPDFFEARAKFVGQALTKYGGVLSGKGEQFQALAGGAAVMYITARIINKLLDDEYHFEPKNAFNIVYNGKAYSLRTVQGDLLHLATEPGRFTYTRLNPVFGRTGMEFATGRDMFGRKRDLAEQAKDFATTAVPISLRGVLNPREQNLWESFLNAFGVTERRSSPVQTISKLVQDFKSKNKIGQQPGEFIYDPEKDPFRPITQAATYSDTATTAKEIGNAVKQGNVTKEQIKAHFLRYATSPFTGSRKHDSEFVKTLTADEKKIYQDALAERRNVLKKFNEAYRLYLSTK